MLIGDSICNAYQSAVRQKLEDCANVSFWASSKCVTDPDYFRELDFMLSARPCTMVSFNNGLHSLVTPMDQWERAYRAAVAFIRDKLPDAALVLTLCTAMNDPARNGRVRELNSFVRRLGDELQLPVPDLFTPMEALDKDAVMTDPYHYRAPAVEQQAALIADCVRETLRLFGSGLKQAATATGPDGALR